MCNEVARRISLGQLREDFSQLKIRLVFPEGAPNMAPLDSVRITDATVIVRTTPGPLGVNETTDLIPRRWSWPGPGGKPVYNYRSDGRDLGNGARQGRCLIPVDSFFEFTAPDDPEQKRVLSGSPRSTTSRGALLGSPRSTTSRGRKTKWRFSHRDHDWFCIAGLWRGGVALASGEPGEAFTMLTCPPGPDVAPYHARQVVVLPRADWAHWLDGTAPSASLCRPSPAGTFTVTREH